MRAREFITEAKKTREDFEGMTIEMVKNGHVLVINALDDWGNNILGSVAFNIGDDNDLDPQDLKVDERYQGQGIAKIMYDYAKSKGYEIHRSYDQTDAGAGFWNKHRGEDVRVWEAFDNPYKGKWEKSEYSGSVDVLTKLPDGTHLSIMFNDEGDGEYQVEFHRNNSQAVTGEGDAQRVFATVLSAIQKFIKKYKPWRLTFSASKDPDEAQNTESRAKLYNRMVQRYARAWGYDDYSEDHGDQITYELTQLKQGVAEDSNQHIPPILYHATYKQRLKSIQLKGLGAGGKSNWTDSKKGVVYLALDPDVAESYAETALDDLDADWEIVILAISTNGLDPNRFQLDRNVLDNEGDTVEYHGIIPPNNISLYKQGVAEEDEKKEDPITNAVIDFYQHVGKIHKDPIDDYVGTAKEMLGHVSDPTLKSKLVSIFRQAKENPYIQGGVVTTIGALLAGGVLNSAQRMGLSPAQTNLALQAILNTVIPTVVSRINGKSWADTAKYTLASAGIGTGIAGIMEEKDTDIDYYMNEGCGIFAVAKAMSEPNSSIYILSNKNGDSWSKSFPYEVTHVFVNTPNVGQSDVKGVRSVEEMGRDFHLTKDDYSIKGPFNPREFFTKFMSSSDSKPLYGTTKDIKNLQQQLQKQTMSEARGLAPTKPYDDLMANMGYFMSLNTVKIQQDAVNNDAQQALADMQQQFRKPILNGMSFFDVNRDPKMSKNPKVAPILLKYVYDMIGYIEPRIKKYIKPDQQGKYLDRLSQIKDDYRAAIAQVS